MSSSAPPVITPEYLAANKGPEILAVIIVFPALAVLVVAFRLYTRFVVVRNASYEDLAIVLAVIFSIATSICQGYQVKNGMGRHIQALTMEQGITSLKALFASIMFYNFGMTGTKVSIILQYMRISIDKNVRRACWVAMGVSVALSIEAFFANIFACYPVAKFWDDRIPGHCINKSAMYYANAAISVVTDFALVILPIFIIRKLQLRRREKYTLAIILGLGGFASIASLLRIRTLQKLDHSTDITWDNPGTATWSVIEMTLGIICASLPTLRAFVIKLFPRIFRSTRGSTPNAKVGYKTSGGSGRTGESDESELVQIPATVRRPSAATNSSDPFADVEKGNGTFYASDSDQGYARSDAGRA